MMIIPLTERIVKPIFVKEKFHEKNIYSDDGMYCACLFFERLFFAADVHGAGGIIRCGGHVVIDVEAREVSVGVSDDGKIHIGCFESEKEFYEIRSEEGVLTMSLVYDKEWTDFIGVKPSDEVRKISVAVPDQMLSDLKVVTTNEKICLDTLSFTGSVSLDSNGGDVSFETLSVGVAVGLTAKDGNISGTLAGGWDDFSISCETKKGECNLPESKPGGAKSLTVQCNNGDVNIAFSL